jgi:pyrimidine-nucleoside phosphorylase
MVTALAPLELLERTRRGEAVDGESIAELVRRWLTDEVSDAQMAAWCMAVCIRGLDAERTAALTAAMIASGDRLDLSRFAPVGDKHSTGGVGDATTLVVAPLAAAMGVKVAKMSGRGLGYTGGTIDKLESIPGYDVDLDLASFVRQVRDVGVAVISPSDRLVPADKRLYALRDQTATFHSAALVASSVMSKKIAGGAQAIVLDVKVGSGAFFPTLAEAIEAAQLMEEIGRPWGRTVRYVASAMEQPLGRRVGNALEVHGAADVLRGRGAEDLRELSLRLAAALAEAAGVAAEGEGRAAAEATLASGAALRAAERWVEAQGGDPAVWTDPTALPQASLRLPLVARQSGWVAALDARGVGEAARWLGAGRLHPDQDVDPAVGVELLRKVGEPVSEGEPLAIVHCHDVPMGDRALEMLAAVYLLADEETPVPRLILAEG